MIYIGYLLCEASSQSKTSVVISIVNLYLLLQTMLLFLRLSILLSQTLTKVYKDLDLNLISTYICFLALSIKSYGLQHRIVVVIKYY